MLSHADTLTPRLVDTNDELCFFIDVAGDFQRLGHQSQSLLFVEDQRTAAVGTGGKVPRCEFFPAYRPETAVSTKSHTSLQVPVVLFPIPITIWAFRPERGRSTVRRRIAQADSPNTNRLGRRMWTNQDDLLAVLPIAIQSGLQRS